MWKQTINVGRVSFPYQNSPQNKYLCMFVVKHSQKPVFNHNIIPKTLPLLMLRTTTTTTNANKFHTLPPIRCRMLPSRCTPSVGCIVCLPCRWMPSIQLCLRIWAEFMWMRAVVRCACVRREHFYRQINANESSNQAEKKWKLIVQLWQIKKKNNNKKYAHMAFKQNCSKLTTFKRCHKNRK